MSRIIFYDTTKLDEAQLADSLKETDHHWEFVLDKISLDNLDSEAEVISVFSTSTITRQIIESMPRLKLVALRSTGYNNVDFTATAERGITVVNVPIYGNETVAEFAFAMLLALTRKLPAVLRAENSQFSPEELTGSDLQGKVFGTLGAGNIGQKALKIASGFSMKTIAYDTFLNEELQKELGFSYVSLDELLAKSDVISIHAPYLPSTHHIMNRENLSKMKPGAILINTARGELVDTKALVELLDSGHLGGAGIDVIEGETLLNHNNEIEILRSLPSSRGVARHSIEIDVLKKMPNVIISPHNAYNTSEAIKRINKTTAQNIIDFWYDKTPNEVIPKQKPMGKLLIVRHGESEWNATGRWSGITDVHLSSKGFKEATLLGRAVAEQDIEINQAYCSEQIRSRETLEGILNVAQKFDVEISTEGALNERDYGEYTGKNKWEMKEILGEEAFNNLRRGWDVAVPGGETLKAVYERVTPFYQEIILPQLLTGNNILIVAHGNSLRALMKHLESISDESISQLQMIFGQIIIYDVDENGLSKGSSVVEIDTEISPNA